MKQTTFQTTEGKEIRACGIKVFGYRIWFQADGTRRFIKNCILANRICRIAEKAERQLLRVQKLANAIQMDGETP